jgi:hypothetical protein
MRLLASAIILALPAAGCATKTVDYQTLQQKSAEHHGAAIRDRTFYCGTKDGFDYFYVEYGSPDFSEGRAYRALSSETPITDRFPYTKEHGGWRETSLYTSLPQR